jgi:hypothetical protein
MCVCVGCNLQIFCVKLVSDFCVLVFLCLCLCIVVVCCYEQILLQDIYAI